MEHSVLMCMGAEVEQLNAIGIADVLPGDAANRFRKMMLPEIAVATMVVPVTCLVLAGQLTIR
jgi:hypothetical protein